ncbi:MAG: hypothetical protein AAF184_11755 [Pseudomonadota bacterium]
MDFIYTTPAPSLDPDDVPFETGDPWSITFTLDDTLEDELQGNFDWQAYYLAPTGFTGAVGDFAVTTPDYSIALFDAGDVVDTDRIATQWRPNAQAENFEMQSFELHLEAAGGDAFDGVGPLSADLYDIDLYDLTESGFVIVFGNAQLNETYNASLTLDSIDVEPRVVPAPATAVLLLSGLAGMAFRFRRSAGSAA